MKTNKFLLRIALLALFSGIVIVSCNKQEEMSGQHPTEQTGLKPIEKFESSSLVPTEQERTADAILSVVTALNALNQSEFCTARIILYNGEMSDSTKLAELEDIGTNGEALVNALNNANSILNGVPSFMDLNNNGGNNSFTEEVTDLMLYERDIIWVDAPKKPDCAAYNANVRAIGNAWIIAAATCAGDVNLACIAGACIIALDALAANDASFPECANGGNRQGMPLNFWWYLIYFAQGTVCEAQN